MRISYAYHVTHDRQLKNMAYNPLTVFVRGKAAAITFLLPHTNSAYMYTCIRVYNIYYIAIVSTMAIAYCRCKRYVIVGSDSA